MTEVSHDDILRRVGAVEKTQEAMSVQLARVESVAAGAREEAERNRGHFDQRIEEVKKAEARTHLELVAHRAEFRGMRSGLGWGLGAVATVVTIGLTIIGWMLANG